MIPMPVNFLEQDFNSLKKFLKKNKLIKKDEPKETITRLKHIHKVCYSFALWDHNLSKRIRYEGKIFLKEIRSDAIQSIPLLLMGYKKPVGILLRSVIENSLKHIYFIDHPVEFMWLTSRPGHFKPMASLYEYIKFHPTLKSVNENFGYDIGNELKQKYDKYSHLVHTQDVSYMQLFRCLSSIKRDKKVIIEGYESDIVDIGNTVNLMFGVFHREKFNKFNQFSRNTILSCMDRHTKQIFHGIA